MIGVLLWLGRHNTHHVLHPYHSNLWISFLNFVGVWNGTRSWALNCHSEAHWLIGTHPWQSPPSQHPFCAPKKSGSTNNSNKTTKLTVRANVWPLRKKQRGLSKEMIKNERGKILHHNTKHLFARCRICFLRFIYLFIYCLLACLIELYPLSNSNFSLISLVCRRSVGSGFVVMDWKKDLMTRLPS